MANNALQIRIIAVDEASRALNQARVAVQQLAGGVQRSHREIATGVDSVSTQLQRAKAQFIAFYAVAPQLKQLASSVFAAAESFKAINARLLNATQGALDFNQAQTATVAIAKSTGASLDSIAGLYGKLRLNAGMAADDAEKLTAILAKATQLDGGGQGAQAALFQLQQGLASGTLRGEELNSVLEQTPTLALQIAKGMGVAQGDLRKLAEDGKLTAEAVKLALFAQTDAIDAMFGNLPVTAARAFENIKTTAITEFGQIDAALGVTSSVGSALQALADNFRAVMGVAVAVAGTITAAWLQSIATRRATETAAHMAALAEIVQRKQAEVAAARATLLARSSAHAAAVTAAATAARADLAAARAAMTLAEAKLAVASAERTALASMAVYGPARARVEAEITSALLARTAAANAAAAAEARLVAGGAAGATAAAATAAQRNMTAAAAGLVAARVAATEAARPVSLLSGLVSALGMAFRFLLGPIGMAITAVAGLTGYLVANRDKVVEVGGEHMTIAESIKAAWGVAAEGIGRGMRWIGEKVGLTGSDIRIIFGGAFAAVLAVAKTVVNGVVGAFVYIGGSLGNIAGSIATRFRIVFEGITDMAGGLWKDVKAALTGDTSFKNTSAAFGKAIGASLREGAQSELARADLLQRAFNTDHAGKALTGMGQAIAAKVQSNRQLAADQQADDWFNEKTPDTPIQGAAVDGKKKGKAGKSTALDDAFWADVDQEQARLMQGRQTVAMAYQQQQDAILNSQREAHEDYLRQGMIFDAEKLAEERAAVLSRGEDVEKVYADSQQRLASIRQRLDAEVGIGVKSQAAAQTELRQEAGKLGSELTAKLIPRLQQLIDTTPDETTREKWRALYAEIEGMRAGPQTGFEGGLNEYLASVKKTTDAIKDVTVKAFKGMEDALTNFVMTGKLDFKSFANSIIADMVRMAIQQSVVKPLMSAAMGFFGFSDGGAVKKADGGYISGPGGPREDKVPAWLSNGEYVIQAAAVQRIGIPALDAINTGKGALKRYASGGMVGGSSLGASGPAAVAAKVSAGGGVTVNQHINIDSRSDQAVIFAAMARAKNEAISAINQSLMRGGATARLAGVV